MRRRFRYIAAVVVALTAAGCRLDEGKRERMVNLQQVKDDPETQLVNLDDAIARSSRDGSLYIRRALLFLKKGDLNKALVDVEEGLRLSRNDPAAFFVKAQVLRGMGQREGALKLALQAERNSYQSPSLFVLLGDLYLQRGELGKASEYIDRALEQAPHDEYSLYYKGRVTVAKGDTARAVNFYNAALEQAAAFLEPQRELATILTAQGKFEAAKPYLINVQQQLPQDGQLWYLRGKIFEAEQKQDSAFWSYSTAIELADSLPGPHYRIGLQLYGRGDNEAAIEHLEKAASFYGRQPKFMSTLASSYERTGQFQKALQLYRQLVAAEPTHTYVYQSIERLKFKTERPKIDTTEALKSLQLW